MVNLNNRVKIYWKIFWHNPWLKMIMIIYACFCLFSTIRDEFLPASMQEEWRVLKFLPAISWEWYFLSFAIIVLFLILEGSYHKIKMLRDIIYNRKKKDELVIQLDNLWNEYTKAPGTFNLYEVIDYEVIEKTSHLMRESGMISEASIYEFRTPSPNKLLSFHFHEQILKIIASLKW